MHGSRPSIATDAAEVMLDSSALIDEEDNALIADDRLSILDAAANARTAAMLTGTHGVVAPPLERAFIQLPSPRELLDEGTAFEEREGEPASTALLRARATAVSAGADAVASMRAHLELARAELADGNVDAARASATLASSLATHAPSAHALLRMLAAGREQSDIDAQLEHVEHLVEHVSDTLVRADFLTEKGRLLEARSGPSVESAAAYAAALALVPDHAGALAGLEAALEATGRWSELTSLLGRLAGLAGDAAASAWLHVERALLFDRRLGDAGTARATLERAIELAPGIGPVRQAFVDHAVVHRDDARLAALLESEAALEKDPARAACLELDGALACLRAGNEATAMKLLEHAHARPRSSRIVDTRIATELARLLEKSSRFGDALRVRKSALAMMSGPRELLALREVAATAERAGEMTDAVLALEQARVLDTDDPTILEDLDRLLVAAGRHEARAVLWMRQAALADEPRAKTRALLVAADASAAGGRETDAARHREAAWIVDPAAPGVFDALAERLAPSGAGDAVAARVELYAKAAERTTDKGKRLYYLEKIAWLWDDVAGDPNQAAQAYEDVLALDPKRRSAIAGLASAATRARDGRKLARALLAEAEVAEHDEAKTEVRLRAAQALTDVDPERALALAETVANGEHASFAMRARELVTRLHATAGRWELVVTSLAGRRAAERKKSAQVALAIAEAAVLAQRLAAPDRALATLEAARELAPDDPAIASAIVTALEAKGDDDALRTSLERLSTDTSDPDVRVMYLVRAAELEERRSGGDEDAVRLYLTAREAIASEAVRIDVAAGPTRSAADLGAGLVTERLQRLGARAPLPGDAGSAVPQLLAAVRSLEAGRPADRTTAETLLASGSHDFATLRVAERLARAARSAPQLANALALAADLTHGTLAVRALSALAAVVAWTLPEGTDLSPWDRLIALDSRDAVVLDDLVRRARPKVAAGDRPATELSIEATQRRLEGAADDTERVVLKIELARLRFRAGSVRDAALAAREALELDASSAGAAVVLAEVAAELGDRRSAVAAATTLADVVRSDRARAALLRDAADLSASEGDPKKAAQLLERALEADPDAVLVAARLATLQAAQGAWSDLARALRRGLFAAKSADAVVPMAAELAEVAKTRLRDPVLAIEALERSREIASDHVPTLFLLAELYIGQRTWDEALRALGDVIACTSERGEKLVARVGRASILGRVLHRLTEAEKELRAALELDPHDLRTLNALLALPVTLEPKERAELLSRVVVSETQPRDRLSALLELARTRRALGDEAGAEGALVEAAALSPDKAWLARLRDAAGGSAEAAARILGRAVARAREAGAAPGVEWLAGLGDLELGLGRFDAAIEHLEEVLRLEPMREPARLALARALSATGRHDAAAATLPPLLDHGGVGLDATFVRQLDEAFTGAGRPQQAIVARELRAIAGDLDEKGLASLRARRPSYAGDGESLSGASLRSFVMPGELGKHPIWDAAAIGASLAGKLARVGLSEQGASSKDRLKPRAVHPIRQMFDRLARVFEVNEVELALSHHAVAPVVACVDATWLVVPASLGDWAEPHAIAALARPLARIALGIPWFGALPAEDTLAVLIAFARQAAPSAGGLPRDRIEQLVGDYDLRARRAIDRKKKKALEDIEEPLTRAPHVALDAFVDAALRTEARAAFLLSGDLRASLDAVAFTEPGLGDALRTPGRVALGAVLSRPIARDLVSFAMGAESTALRRNLGTLWS
jgi:tetratricopeptide (TPR) repeat protein